MEKLPRLLVNALVGVLEVVLDDVCHSPNGSNDKVLVRLADAVLPTLRELEPVTQSRQIVFRKGRVYDLGITLHHVDLPIRRNQLVDRQATAEHVFRFPLYSVLGIRLSFEVVAYQAPRGQLERS